MSIQGFHFISYSSIDGRDIAESIQKYLEDRQIDVWLDIKDIRLGTQGITAIGNAIALCESVIFIATKDSIDPISVCFGEYLRARELGKLILPLLCEEGLVLLPPLNIPQYINFDPHSEESLEILYERIVELESPTGKIERLELRLQTIKREMKKPKWSGTPQYRKFQSDIDRITQQIEQQRNILGDPQGIAQQIEENIAQGLKREQTIQNAFIQKAYHTLIINASPGMVSPYFQDRSKETRTILSYLSNNSVRLIIITGRSGVGKTALVVRLLKAIEEPGTGNNLMFSTEEQDITKNAIRPTAKGIVNLGDENTKKITAFNLFNGLVQLLPDTIGELLRDRYTSSPDKVKDHFRALADYFPVNQSVFVFLDNFETTQQDEIMRQDLELAISALLDAPPHGIKLILTSRIFPSLMTKAQVRRVDLDDGLPSPYAENLLRELDEDGAAGLKNAEEALLNQARIRTLGYPRTLEALYSTLSMDLSTTLESILEDTEKTLPENVLEVFVGEAFNRLERPYQQVIQALAVYNRPVPPVAVDYLLQPYVAGMESTPLLNQLMNMHFVRRETVKNIDNKDRVRFYLHSADREYALSTLKRQPSIENATGVEFLSKLFRRAADYFVQVRRPRSQYKSLEDIQPQLAEYDLRCDGQEYDQALLVLLDINLDYLYKWGNYREMVSMHEKLLHKTLGSDARELNIGYLGHAYLWLHKLAEAESCYKEALALARQRHNRQAEGVWLSSLADVYDERDDFDEAIKNYQQGLDIAREVDDAISIVFNLGDLGWNYRLIGQTYMAINYHEQALQVAQPSFSLTIPKKLQTNQLARLPRRHSRESKTTDDITNLGTCYLALGKTDKAIDRYKEALQLANSINDNYGIAVRKYRIAYAYLNLDQFFDAINLCLESIELGDRIELVQVQCEARWVLAQAYLFTDNYKDACAVAEKGWQFDYGTSQCNNAVALGIACLLRGDVVKAERVFKEALDSIKKLLTKNPTNFMGWDARGILECGLTLCNSQNKVSEAKTSFTKARFITKDTGTVQFVLRLFDKLCSIDKKGVLRPVRNVATGKTIKIRLHYYHKRK